MIEADCEVLRDYFARCGAEDHAYGVLDEDDEEGLDLFYALLRTVPDCGRAALNDLSGEELVTIFVERYDLEPDYYMIDKWVAGLILDRALSAHN